MLAERNAGTAVRIADTIGVQPITKTVGTRITGVYLARITEREFDERKQRLTHRSQIKGAAPPLRAP